MKTALGFGLAAVLVVLAVLAALLAADVRGWQTTLRENDALLAVRARGGDTAAGHASRLARGANARRERRRRRAARDRALPRERQACRCASTTRTQVALARGRAEQALASVARSSDGARASQAETLLGVLVFTDVGPSTDPFEETAPTDPDQAQASVGDFQDAVRADPANAVAKYDLELALRALLAQGVRVGAGQQTGAGATGRRGAGGGVPGSGY